MTTPPKKRKTLQRWRQLAALGAEVYDADDNKWLKVKTQPQALDFFRTIAFEHGLGAIPREDADHEWLAWLVEGHYAYKELCPVGIDYFVVHRNCDIGFKGDDLGFGVVSIGARGFARPFSVKQALLGVPKNEEEKRRLAFRNAIEDDVSEWSKWHWRPVMQCAVFGGVLEPARVHVDHDPPLQTLVEEFCRQQFKTPTQFDVEDTQTGWQLQEPVRSQWRQFHWYNARLQFVSIEGHLELDRRRRLAERAGIIGLCP
jgi:hypothetical protein